MTVNEKGLEPCPFCGGPAELDNAAEPQFARRPTVTCANEDCFGYMPSAYFATDKEAIAAWNRRASIVGAEPVLANVLGDENDLHSVSHALDIGGIGTPYRAYQGSLYCDYQPHRIADFQDYGLALAASVLFNSAKAIKAALAHPAPSAGEGGVKGLAGAEYEAIHRRAIEAYEAATPPDYRYSATALRKAVDAARAEEARILTAIEPVAASPGVPDGGWVYLVYDWAWTDDTGQEHYARTPERAERLKAEGRKLTPVYTRERRSDLAPPSPEPSPAGEDVLRANIATSLDGLEPCSDENLHYFKGSAPPPYDSPAVKAMARELLARRFLDRRRHA